MSDKAGSSKEAGFLSRWSRRKQAAARPRPDDTALQRPGAEPVAAPELPDIESLGSGSDYAVFLQKGVTAVVQAAALRKAWTSDPGIAEFRGMADYDWDFNAAGYGRLRVGDDVAQLLRNVIATPGEAEHGPISEPGVDSGAGEAMPAVATVRQSAPPVVAEAVENVTEPGEPGKPVAVAALPRHGSARPV